MPFSSATLPIVLVNGCGVPARIISPLIAQRMGSLNTSVPMLTISALVVYCWAGVNNIADLYSFAVFYGISNASFQCLMPITVASLTRQLDMVGTRLGMCFSVVSFAALTGGPIGGAIVSAAGYGRHGYVCAMVWAATAGCLGCVLVLAGRLITYDKRIRVKC